MRKNSGLVVNALFVNWCHDRDKPVAVILWDGEEGLIYCDNHYTIDANDFKYRNLDWDKLCRRLTDFVFAEGTIIYLNARQVDIRPEWKELRNIEAKTAIPLLSKSMIDLSVDIPNLGAHRSTINDAVRETLGDNVALHNNVSPAIWRKGSEGQLISNCIEDTKTIYDLWDYGVTKGFIRLRSRVTGIVEEVTVDWRNEE